MRTIMSDIGRITVTSNQKDFLLSKISDKRERIAPIC